MNRNNNHQGKNLLASELITIGSDAIVIQTGMTDLYEEAFEAYASIVSALLDSIGQLDQEIAAEIIHRHGASAHWKTIQRLNRIIDERYALMDAIHDAVNGFSDVESDDDYILEADEIVGDDVVGQGDGESPASDSLSD